MKEGERARRARGCASEGEGKTEWNKLNIQRMNSLPYYSTINRKTGYIKFHSLNQLGDQICPCSMFYGNCESFAVVCSSNYEFRPKSRDDCINTVKAVTFTTDKN